MNTENRNISGQRSRWLRAALLTYSLASPAISDRSLAAAARAYTSAIDDLARQAGLAA